MQNIIKYLRGYWKEIRFIVQLSPHDSSNERSKSYERYRRILLTGGSTAIVKFFSAIINAI